MYIYVRNIPEERSISLFFLFLFFSKDEERESHPISLIRRFPIYARYESTRGQAEESVGL